VSLGRNDGAAELYALLDGHGFIREGLERRLAERFDHSGFGWARFPRDGVTLQTLIEHARATMRDVQHANVVDLTAQLEAQAASAEKSGPAPALEHAAGRP
jgi:hypothetical protein